MGETLTVSHFPEIRFRVSQRAQKRERVTLFLIRGGRLIRTVKGETPLEVAYEDREVQEGRKTFYRVMDSRKRLISNPLFVKYQPTEKK
jgi:hypothetical protein